MANLNKVFLMGRLTQDPELRYTPAGAAVCDLKLAVNRRYTTSQGEQKEETCFVTVTVWRRNAELCAEYLRKSSTVFVEGSLRLDVWESQGQKRSKLIVVAHRIQFLDKLGRSKKTAPTKPTETPSALTEKEQNPSSDVNELVDEQETPETDIPF